MITSEAVNRAIDYILEHLEEDLSLEKVAMHCHFPNTIFPGFLRPRPGRAFMALSNG